MALVMSFSDSTAQLAPGLGILIGGVITELTMSRVAFAVAAVGAAVFAASVPLLLRQEAPRFTETQAGVREGKSLV
jgi:MFS family permease